MYLDLRINSRLSPNIYDRLKKISFTNKDIFNNLIGTFSKDLSNNLDWLLTRSASRNTHQSQLFYRFCCINLVYELINDGTKIEKIITDSKAFKKALTILKKKQSAEYEIELSNIKSSIFNNYIIKVVKHLLISWRIKQYQFSAAKKTKHLSKYGKKNDLILIDVFILQNFINKDRYYKGLWEKLNLDQRERVFFVPTLVMIDKNNFEQVFKKLRNDNRNFLIKEDFLTFFDLFYSFLHLIRVLLIKLPLIKLFDTNFSLLVKEEMTSPDGYNNTLEGIINYRFAKRLKEKSFNLSLVIDWWEGQPLDKGWNLGFNTFFPEIHTKGYLGYAPRTMELHLHPTESEVKYGAAPETISTIGKQFSKEMESANSAFKAETAPAFRFGHVWDNGADQDQASGTFKILMALSIMVDESVNILEQVIDSGVVENEEFEFILKPHPTVQFDTLKNHLSDKWSSRFQKGENPTSEEIRKSDLIITGMSSVGLEAVVMGIPVIIVETLSGLAFDPIPDSVPKELWQTCISPNEISEAISFFKNRTSEEIIKHKELSNQIKNDYFEPVTKEGVYRFLEMGI